MDVAHDGEFDECVDVGRLGDAAQGSGMHDVLPRSGINLLIDARHAGNGATASCGNTGGAELHATCIFLPCAGYGLLDIDSANIFKPMRKKISRRMATELHPAYLILIAQLIVFS